MKTTDWAEQECRIACKRENPDYDFDSNEFDYGCSCYKSALKAYRSLIEDEHSGASFGFTKNILIRMMNGQPLTPINDEDFFKDSNGEPVVMQLKSDESLKKQGLKSDIHCPRMSSLFRTETLDGKVSYLDIDRSICVEAENPSDCFYSGDSKIVDELFPITMPYSPSSRPYEVYCKTFLADKKNGDYEDYDTRAILYVKTPDGNKIDVNQYWTEKEGKWTSITKEEYDVLYQKAFTK